MSLLVEGNDCGVGEIQLEPVIVVVFEVDTNELCVPTCWVKKFDLHITPFFGVAGTHARVLLHASLCDVLLFCLSGCA